MSNHDWWKSDNISQSDAKSDSTPRGASHFAKSEERRKASDLA